jgi:hypothetical protein
MVEIGLSGVRMWDDASEPIDCIGRLGSGVACKALPEVATACAEGPIL